MSCERILPPVSGPAEVHCTAVYVLRNDKFSRLRGSLTPLSFIPGQYHLDISISQVFVGFFVFSVIY